MPWRSATVSFDRIDLGHEPTQVNVLEESQVQSRANCVRGVGSEDDMATRVALLEGRHDEGRVVAAITVCLDGARLAITVRWVGAGLLALVGVSVNVRAVGRMAVRRVRCLVVALAVVAGARVGNGGDSPQKGECGEE